MKIAILGATSHIAKGLIVGLLRTDRYELYLFSRKPEQVERFCRNQHARFVGRVLPYPDFGMDYYDCTINCVGIGDPGQLKNAGARIFTLTEDYDNLILEYLEKNSGSVCVNFSSGAVYGTDFAHPADETTLTTINVNRIDASDYYRIAKIHSEAKHRGMKHLNVVDLRVFGYFSRFIDPTTKFLMTDVIASIREKTVLKTGKENITRDYVHPEDLLSLIELCIERRSLNLALDVYSRQPVAKFEMLDYFAKEYGLRYVIDESLGGGAITGCKSNYYSVNKAAAALGYVPRYTALEAIADETRTLFSL